MPSLFWKFSRTIVKDNSNNDHLIYLGIFGGAKLENDEKFGTTKGQTYLSVGINKHHSLQLCLDKYTVLNDDKAFIWHNGTLTVGKLGQAKRSTVIDFINGKAPYLIDKEMRVILGEFDIKQPISSTQKSTQDFVQRLIHYALLRDEFRVSKKKGVL